MYYFELLCALFFTLLAPLKVKVFTLLILLEVHRFAHYGSHFTKSRNLVFTGGLSHIELSFEHATHISPCVQFY